MRKVSTGSAEEEYPGKLLEEDGEVTQLAISFNTIITTERAYHGPMAREDTQQMFRERAEQSQMDGAIGKHFIRLVEAGGEPARAELEADT